MKNQLAMQSRLALSLVLSLALHCHTPKVRTQARAAPALGSALLKGKIKERTTFQNPDAVGISGSCFDGASRWFVTERKSHLLKQGLSGLTSYPIDGLPQGYDLEGLACKNGLFYVSTETEVPNRIEDFIFVLIIEKDRARVIETLAMQYPDPMRAGVNQGLEGLCIAGNWLIASGEIIRTTASGVRKAPILMQKLGSSDTFLRWVNLTSTTGKLSGLDCRASAGVIEVFAVERHYEVARVIQFELGTSDSKVKTLLSLEDSIGETENFEGILVGEKGEVWLVNDNQYNTITGPSQETLLERIKAFSH